MASTTLRRNLRFDRIYNFRDVGATINASAGKRLIKEGILYRSGRLDQATSADHNLLRSLNIKTVIDLRTSGSASQKENENSLIWTRDNTRNRSEHQLRARNQQPSSPIAALDHTKEPPQQQLESNWNTVRINFIGPDFEKKLVRELRWWKLSIFALLMLFRFRLPALRMLGKNVLRPKGLAGMSSDALKYAQPEILTALNAMLHPSAYPVLIHCTQGKDRTGLLLTIILLLVEDVPLSAIKHDYMLSDEGLLPVREKMVNEMTAIGMGEEYSKALQTFVEQTKGFLEGYGGVRKYLEGIGFDAGKQKDLVEVLRAE